MEDLTKFRLRRLAEQMLIILRDDKEVGFSLVGITANAEGYMSVMEFTDAEMHCDMSKVPESNAWKNFNAEPTTVIETYRCHQCLYAGATGPDGGTHCSKCKSVVDADGNACNEFKDYFYSNKVFLDRRENEQV